MGQPITVVEKPSPRPGIARFEINRSLTGMGHERYGSEDDILADRPVDELARRLFATGAVDRVHVNGSVITVHLAGSGRSADLLEVIRGLYIFYPQGEGGPGAPGAPASSNGDAASEPSDTLGTGSPDPTVD
jgi:hypothetical protein